VSFREGDHFYEWQDNTRDAVQSAEQFRSKRQLNHKKP